MKKMTLAEMESLAHELRVLVTERTCCPAHASDVLLWVLAGFALDSAEDCPSGAAEQLLAGAKQVAHQLITGQFKIVRRLS